MTHHYYENSPIKQAICGYLQPRKYYTNGWHGPSKYGSSSCENCEKVLWARIDKLEVIIYKGSQLHLV